ncbi:pilus assembly PilX family protein [Halochromatium roseum]|uniref:pilus assembly PilX family protein n=1 Tax=Halochromatium roseum TaxID=391920 RepID=UPI001913CF20|nr:pilus assembly PilX N-terminal domain-containing protein [Halochromatium roseum]
MSDQRGAVALVVGLMLLFLGTAGTFYVSKSSIIDQRISANAIRAKAAFESAEAGLNFATAFMDVDKRDLNGNGTDDRVDMLTGLVISGNDDMDDDGGREFDDCDTDGDGDCDGYDAGTGDGYLLQAVWDSNNQVYSWSLPTNAGSCDLDVSGDNVRNCLLIQMADNYRVVVSSTGYSDDRLALKTIVQEFRRIAPSPGNLNASHALITYAGVAVAGSMSVINVFSNATIWSGGEVSSFGGTNSGTFVHPDPDGPTAYTDATTGDLVPFFDRNGNNTYETATSDELLLDYTANANSSTYSGSDITKSSGVFENEVMLGADIIDDSEALRCDKTADPDCFFNNFIAGPPDFAKSAADYVTTDDRLVDPEGNFGIPGSYIWVDARNSDNSLSDFGFKNETYGTPEEPIILVIDGNFDPQGSWRMYGVLYVRGDVVGGGTGGGLLIGSAIVEGDIGVDNSGGMDVIYDPNVIGRSGGGDSRISSVPIAGTWRDWQ